MAARRSHVRYSRWDGTQVTFDLDADSVLAEINDDLLYHGDLAAALRRMMHSGFADRNGERVQGIRDLMERLRERRRERLAAHNLGGVYEELADQLREVIDTERSALNAADDLDPADRERRLMDLDLLPPDLVGTVRGLQNHQFASEEAREKFDGLLDAMREQLAQRWFSQTAGAMSNPSPEAMARTKDMLAALNAMFEERAAGRAPDFAGFMNEFGDFFPENPANLDELLEVMAHRMAAMSAMLNSLSADQRAELDGLARALLDDLDLSWQMDQLSANLQREFPNLGWNRRYDFDGLDPLGFSDAMEVLGELGDLDQIEALLRGAANPGALAEVDLDRARDLLGADAAESLERLAEVGRLLSEAGLIDNREGRYELTAEGLRQVGRHALRDLFSKLARDAFGQHQTIRVGVGHERAADSKPYEFGDPFNLDIERTIRNALARGGTGTPVSLSPEDFEVARTEQVTRTATVVMIDLSLSMPMRDNFLPAKKVAMALHALITSRFPRDYLGMVGFSEVARMIEPRELPEVSWDYVYGTNMQHGFMLARRLLAREHGDRQIIMITDGEPTAHLNERGDPEFHYPPVRATVDATLAEVARATREGIRINTFMLDPSPALRGFVERLTELNRGRAFFTTPENLGDYVLVDFLDSRRQSTRRVG